MEVTIYCGGQDAQYIAIASTPPLLQYRSVGCMGEYLTFAFVIAQYRMLGCMGEYIILAFVISPYRREGCMGGFLGNIIIGFKC